MKKDSIIKILMLIVMSSLFVIFIVACGSGGGSGKHGADKKDPMLENYETFASPVSYSVPKSCYSKNGMLVQTSSGIDFSNECYQLNSGEFGIVLKNDVQMSFKSCTVFIINFDLRGANSIHVSSAYNLLGKTIAVTKNYHTTLIGATGATLDNGKTTYSVENLGLDNVLQNKANLSFTFFCVGTDDKAYVSSHVDKRKSDSGYYGYVNGSGYIIVDIDRAK